MFFLLHTDDGCCMRRLPAQQKSRTGPTNFYKTQVFPTLYFLLHYLATVWTKKCKTWRDGYLSVDVEGGGDGDKGYSIPILIISVISFRFNVYNITPKHFILVIILHIALPQVEESPIVTRTATVSSLNFVLHLILLSQEWRSDWFFTNCRGRGIPEIFCRIEKVILMLGKLLSLHCDYVREIKNTYWLIIQKLIYDKNRNNQWPSVLSCLWNTCNTLQHGLSLAMVELVNYRWKTNRQRCVLCALLHSSVSASVIIWWFQLIRSCCVHFNSLANSLFKSTLSELVRGSNRAGERQ